jgi:hypothetical protein
VPKKDHAETKWFQANFPPKLHLKVANTIVG